MFDPFRTNKYNRNMWQFESKRLDIRMNNPTVTMMDAANKILAESKDFNNEVKFNSAHSYTEGSDISFDVPETLNTKKPCRHHEPGKQCDIFIGKEFCSTQPCEQ